MDEAGPELTELDEGCAEWQRVLAAAGLAGDACVVSVCSVRGWKADVAAHELAKHGLGESASVQLLVYRPSALVKDLDAVIAQGWPSGAAGGRETFVTEERNVSFEGDPICFGNGTRGTYGTFLLCDLLSGPAGPLLECAQDSVLTRDALAAAGHDCARVGNTWVTYERAHALPRFVLRTVAQWKGAVREADYCAPLRVLPHTFDDALVVHVRGDAGDLLQAAIDAAPAGATIVVHEGTYREAIVLSGKSLRLRGEGKAVIAAPPDRDKASRPTATVRLSGAHHFVLDGLVIRANKRRKRPAPTDAMRASWAVTNPDVLAVMKQRRANKKGAGATASAKDQFVSTAEGSTLIDQGRCANALEVVDAVAHAWVTRCELEGGAEVSGEARAWFSHSTLVDGVVNGLYVCKAAVLMEDCEVACHDSANVAVEQSEAVFLRCRVWGSLSTGVYLFNGGCATIAECDIFGNAQTGIQMEGATTQPQVRRNRIHHGEQYGMFITDKAGGIIEANRFYANTWAAVAFTEGGNSLVVSNVVYRGFHYGLYCFDNGRGHCVGNYVYRNKDAGLSVASGGAPLVEGNEFMHGHSFGCYFFLKGMGEVKHNKIYGHQTANVSITYGSNPTLIGNAIYGSEAEGVSVQQEGCGLIERNEIYNNYEANVLCQFDANPTVRGNRIYGSRKTGVVCLHKARGVIEGNDIFASEYSGLAIKTGAAPVVERNHIHDNKRYGLLVQMGGRGRVTGNRFSGGNRLGSCRVWSDCPELVLKDNAFEDAAELKDTKLERFGSPAAAPQPSPPSTPAPPLPPRAAGDDDDQHGATAAATRSLTTEHAHTITLAAAIPGERYEEFNDQRTN